MNQTAEGRFPGTIRSRRRIEKPDRADRAPIAPRLEAAVRGEGAR